MKYVGARYMPKFLGTHDNTTAYEALSVVDNGMGTTYVSNKPVPAGTPLTDTDYWAVYGMSTGAILNLQQQIDDMNDGTVPGSLQNQIDDNTSDITALANKVDNTLKNINGRKFVFIGDSYMTGESSGPTIPSYISYVKTYLGLVEGTTCYTNAHSGYGFKNNEFASLVDAVALNMTNAEKATITDVIVLGGINDANSIISDEDDILSKIQAFINTCKNYFPNCAVHVGQISKDYSGRFQYNKASIDTYKKCTHYGADYYDGIENVLRDLSQFLSDGHPSAEGHKALAKYLVQCILSGSCSVYYKPKTSVITPETGVTITGGNIVAEVKDGIVSVRATTNISFSIPSQTFGSFTDRVKVGTLTDGYIIGDNSTNRYFQIDAIIVNSSPGTVQKNIKLQFDNKNIYLLPWDIINVLTSVTEIRVTPFELTALTTNI